MDTKNIIVGAVILAVGFGLGFLIFGGSNGFKPAPGATPGNLLVEQYDPYWQYNGGLNTALPINTSSTLGVGSTTPAESLGITGSAILNEANATTSVIGVECFNMVRSNGVLYRVYIAATTTVANYSNTMLAVEPGSCQ